MVEIQQSLNRADPDLADSEEKCSGRTCDEDCIKAAAALECQAACSHEPNDCNNDVAFDTSKSISDACSEHLREAFEKYAGLLEQTRCICSRVLADQRMKCGEGVLTMLNTGSSTTTSGRPVNENGLRQRRRLPCFDKRAMLRETLCKPERQQVICCQPRQAPPARKSYGLDSKVGSCCTTSACKSSPPNNHGADTDLERGTGYVNIVFNVAGMECTGCEGIVRKALGRLPGVSILHITFITGSASCTIDPTVTTVNEVIRTMQRTTKYKLSRLEDEDQYLDLIMPEHAIQAIPLLPEGINSTQQLTKTTLRVGYNAAIIGARSVLAHFPDASLAPPSQDQALSDGIKHVRRMLIYTASAAALTAPVLVLAWAHTSVSQGQRLIISLVLASFVQALAVPVFYTPAIKALVASRVIEMDMLVVISITAAYAYSLIAFAILMAGITLETGPFFETSTLLITLVLLGRLIAACARNRAVESVSLQSLQANKALLATEDGQSIDARLLHIDDIVIVPAGSQIVTDGIVCEGLSEVDESMLTGESLPVLKAAGSDIVAGTMNGNGVLKIRVTRLPGRNTITDIAKLVEQAHSEKPRVQDLADRVAGYFVPVVIVVALTVTAIWLGITLAVKHQQAGAAVGRAITYGIAVLAISCPCAIGLAVPLVLVIAGGKAARAGIIVKTANVIERGYRTTDVVFDKTGTLTEDKLTVVEEAYMQDSTLDEDQLAGLVKAMVDDNNHPVSKAVFERLQCRQTSDTRVSNVQALPGLGITCNHNGISYYAGNAEWTEMSTHPQVRALAAQGLTLLCITTARQLLALYALRSTMRPEAQIVLEILQKRHLRVHIVSGDTQEAVHAIADQLKIPRRQAHGCCSPSKKQQYVRNLVDGKKTVLFCGDGTNDAVAVAQASIGVQIVPSASDITRASADVVLMSNDLAGILQILDLSKAAYLRICFNFLWAALYNVFAILLAGGAFVNFRIEPAYAGLGEVVSVLPVVLAALTIRRPKRTALLVQKA
ncbi:hypothetical protein AMS68_006237 [Peltaster fructicola]|uniref:HMA domain-containing protein n=1 Tax=Peltaster fructicola TaxID=286661 RepID=A0A6H0Y254_9PEZI|nr:hypothetical protein AMS68_006237 [Peltaster fructicola]